MKTILITGGCGFVGSHLSLFLKQKKYQVVVVDNLSIGKKFLFRGNKFYKINLNNKKKLDQIFKKYNWPTVDITRKSVEETAASVIKIYEIEKEND